MKTYNDWHNSKLSLSKFLQFGDEVDESIQDYFIEVLPPKTWNKRVIQMGEPYNHNKKGQPQYLTIVYLNNKWIYAGIKPIPNDLLSFLTSVINEQKTITNSVYFPDRSTRRQIRLDKVCKNYRKNYGNSKPRYN